MPTFVELVPDPNDLLAMEIEDLADVVLRVIPGLFQNGHVWAGQVGQSPYPPNGLGPGYPPNTRRQVGLAVAEALSWLEAQGFIFPDPDQNGRFLRLSRRGEQALHEGGVLAYRHGRSLPPELLHADITKKVRPQFLRGDYDVAVFQAFKIVEIHVRSGANALGAEYPDNKIGVDLMRQAFAPARGPLADKDIVPAEQEAMASLFSGAIGHAKNPMGHRDAEISPMEAARLIIFASYLLDVVFMRVNAERLNNKRR